MFGGGVWRDTVIFLVFKNGGTSPAFSHRGDSEEEDKQVHDFCHLPAHCAWIRCSLSFLTPRSCTRLPRSDFAQCTACRWALRCTFWSCWYLGWTWLWTDWWPARNQMKHNLHSRNLAAPYTQRLVCASDCIFNRDVSLTSWIRALCRSTLRAFMILTIAACKYILRSSSTALLVCSISCWPHGLVRKVVISKSKTSL